MFDNILLVYSERLTKSHINVVEKIKEIIERENKKCFVVSAENLQANLFDNSDLVITIGGDGTFIKASHYLKEKLILGINADSEISEGALTSINENELDKLKNILLGKFTIIKRNRIEITRNGITLDKLALNEVYIGSLNQFHTSRYIIKLKEKEEEQRSSGVLIATGSGSNAWYKSAGGKAFSYDEKKLKFLVREPYFGRIFKPQLLYGEIKEGERIAFESKRYSGGVIAIDSDAIYDFNNSDIVEIELADKPLNVIVK